VRIGDHTWIGPFCSLDGTAGLVIGRYCSISLGCQLLSHDTVKGALSRGRMSYEYTNTKIDDCCFLGSYAVISEGVTIGNHCLIAAGAVVINDIDDYTIAGGVPAEHIGKVEIDQQGEVYLVYNDL
jgi:acetyltransferase-like isoleucine patch superfamily enzyme